MNIELSLKFKSHDSISLLRAPAPHLDYHQNDTERKIFYESYNLPVPFGDNKNEPNVLMGVFDKEDEKLGVMLGVWKPIQPDHVSSFHPSKIILKICFYHTYLDL